MTRDLAIEQRWRDRIEECRQSGQSIKAWCMQNELKNTTYYYWARKFKILEPRTAGDNTFAEMVLLPGNNYGTKATQNITERVSLYVSFGDYSIGILDGFNPHTLAELVKVLQKL